MIARPILRIASLLLALAASTVAAAELKLMIAVDPSDDASGFVYTEEIVAGIARAAGVPVRATKTENLGEAMRSTRTAEFDIYIVPAHELHSFLNCQFIQRFIIVY